MLQMQQTRPYQTQLPTKLAKQRKEEEAKEFCCCMGWYRRRRGEARSKKGRADLCFMIDSDDSEDDEPNEVSKLSHSNL